MCCGPVFDQCEQNVQSNLVAEQRERLAGVDRLGAATRFVVGPVIHAAE
ncbi:MAG: hypothetical protein J07HX64_02090 [halophilic archaeon J07HX64]|nr:MAG: hypothetical protein J07HX64_02090 [halophilic archaeon J07HX64]